jgi:hypothetical protein
VVFQPNIKYPFDDIPMLDSETMRVFIPEDKILSGAVDIVSHLRNMSKSHVRLMQWRLNRASQYMQYSDLDSEFAQKGEDALSLLLHESFAAVRRKL